MNFVEKALSLMNKGYAAIIIQSSTGIGKAKEYNKRILEENTLLVSIKMPEDLFIGKSIVQTHIYVFRVNEPHQKDEVVKFIDFSNDGFTRTNRRKASTNLKDTHQAKERYEELVNLVRFGKSKMNIFSESNYYENTIDPKSGEDWNQSAPIDTKPSLQDFKNTIAEFLDWEVSNHQMQKYFDGRKIEKIDSKLNRKLKGTEWKEFKLKELFDIHGNPQLNKSSFTFGENADYPYFTRTVLNNGIAGYVEYLDEDHKIEGNCLAVGMLGMQFFYMEKDFYAGQFTKRAIPKSFVLNKRRANYFISMFNKYQKDFQSVLVRNFERTFNETVIQLPVKNKEIDFDFIENFISDVEKERITELELQHKAIIQNYLSVTGHSDKVSEKS
jgi:hypothetical protein